MPWRPDTIPAAYPMPKLATVLMNPMSLPPESRLSVRYPGHVLATHAIGTTALDLGIEDENG
jgi:hypothetical protein